MSENVLVIPTELAQNLAPKTWNTAEVNIQKTILENHSFRERKEAETNFAFKQVIPYLVVTHSGPLYLLAQRTKKQEEERLHNMYSIGQGGHINDLDFDSGLDPITAGLRREIVEEFTLGNIVKCYPVGVINDNSNEVGQVHLGLVYLVHVATTDLEVAEKGKHIAEWADVPKLQAHYAEMENWSKIVMDHFILRS